MAKYTDDDIRKLPKITCQITELSGNIPYGCEHRNEK